MVMRVGNPLYSLAAWRALRLACLERDGYRCQVRLPGCLGRASAADHIVELADGGARLELGNLQAACKPCNTAKRNWALQKRRSGDGRRRVRRW